MLYLARGPRWMREGTVVREGLGLGIKTEGPVLSGLVTVEDAMGGRVIAQVDKLATYGGSVRPIRNGPGLVTGI